MATSLQQQLAAISTKSTDQLNLKAQKTRHAQSLLFESRDAARQSFDTLFQICNEGFDDLCQLDGRFRPFRKNLFAPTSIEVEREHLTAKENSELDDVVARFLGLVTGRLLLRPALKSMEWLVRRWRVHEHNTATLIYTFLPYHRHDLFSTLQSILPKDLGKTFDFLKPYIAAASSPPRHALVSAMTRKPTLFSGYSTFVISAARRAHHSAAIVDFWASLVAQSAHGMLTAADSGREVVRKQKTEDVLLQLLPVIQDALSVAVVPELYSAACIMVTIVVGNAELDDTVIDALMEALALSWNSETIEDGVHSLALLADRKDNTLLPKSVTRSFISFADDTLNALIARQEDRQTHGLLIGLVLSALDMAGEMKNDQCLRFAMKVAGSLHLTGPESTSLRQKVQMLNLNTLPIDAQHTHEELLEKLQGNESNANASPLAQITDVYPDEVVMEDTINGVNLQANQSSSVDVQSSLDALPDLPGKPFSFLSTEPFATELFEAYSTAFETMLAASHDIKAFVQLPALSQEGDPMSSAAITFLARQWTVSARSTSRVMALDAATNLLEHPHQSPKLDLQALIPYTLAALSDKSRVVRQAAAKLTLCLARCYSTISKDDTVEVWSKNSVYGTQSSSIHWLDTSNAQRLMTAVIPPVLEDCVVDSAFICRTLSDALNETELKASLRSSISSMLASHSSASPSSPVKLVLLEILARVGKAASQAKRDIIVPYLRSIAIKTEHSQDEQSETQAFIRCIGYRTNEEIEILRQIALEAADTVSSSAFLRLSDIFKSLKTQSQMTVSEFLLDQSLMTGQKYDRSAMATDVLRRIRIAPEVQAHLLESIPDVASPQDLERPSKRQRTNKGTPEKRKIVDQSKLNDMLRRATLILELVESSKIALPKGSQDIQIVTRLIRCHFHLLGELHHWKTVTGSDMGYLQTLILSNLLTIVNALSDASIKDLDRSVIRTDLIVETLRSTSSPQVHNSALLLISKLAVFVPETVLHTVMPLFTFISSNTIRQTDRYSAHVVDMTVESIVPPLVDSLRKRGKDLVSGAAELLLSFSAAFEHIPSHRRLNTFTHLVVTLGPKETLHAVVAMLLERYREDNTVEDFVRDLMNGFSIEDQLHATKLYVDLILDACKPKRELADSILAFNEKNPSEVHESVAVLLEGASVILQNQHLRRRLAIALQEDPKTTNDLRSTYSELLERLIALPDSRSSVNFQEPRIMRAQKLALGALLDLLPAEDFINSSASLMQAGSEQVRCQVFASLTARAEAAKSGSVELARVFLEVLPGCTAFLTEAQPVSVRQASIQCIDCISEKYGKIDRSACAAAGEVVAGKAALASDDIPLRVSALLCLASMVEILAADVVSFLPKSLDLVVQYLEEIQSSHSFSGDLQSAAFSFANAVLDHAAWLITSEHLERLLVLAGQSLESADEESEQVSEFRGLVAQKVDTPQLFAAMSSTFGVIRQQSPSAITLHVQMLHNAIRHRSKAVVTRHAQHLFQVLFQAFDLRSDSAHSSDADMQNAYETTRQAALDMTLKLSDTTFRPFFIRLIGWAVEDTTSNEVERRTQRGIAMWDFVHVLFEQLGSIVTNYSGFVLDDAVAVLTASSEDMTSNENEKEHVQTVLKALSSSFRHDQDDFWVAPQHFEAVCGPLLGLIARPMDISAEHLRPVAADFAAAVSNSTDHLKVVNSHLLAYLRHRDPAVRLAAVSTQRTVTERLTFDWLNLLPEMLPFISESLEDDDEKVERETLLWVRQIEEVTGESLEGMLA